MHLLWGRLLALLWLGQACDECVLLVLLRSDLTFSFTFIEYDFKKYCAVRLNSRTACTDQDYRPGNLPIFDSVHKNYVILALCQKI